MNDKEKYGADSWEEVYFIWWLEELKSKGFIKSYTIHPKGWDLGDPLIKEYEKEMKTKTKILDETLMKGKYYSCDFDIEWDESAENKFYVDMFSRKKKMHGASCNGPLISMINHMSGLQRSYNEVKPVFDQNNMTVLASVNIKWVWSKFKDYVNLVIPQKHFSKTFTPQRYFFNNIDGKLRKSMKIKTIRTLDEYLDSLK